MTTAAYRQEGPPTALAAYLLGVIDELFSPRKVAQQRITAATQVVDDAWDAIDPYLHHELPGGTTALLEEYDRRLADLTEARNTLRKYQHDRHLQMWVAGPLHEIERLRQLAVELYPHHKRAA